MKDSCDYPILGRKAEITGEPGKEPHRQGERDEEIQVSWICVQQRQRGTLYPCTPEITAESQEQASGTDAQEPGKECPTGNEERQAVYDRMAELLWDSVHEEPNRGMERMHESKSDVHTIGHCYELQFFCKFNTWLFEFH